ncbi:cytochrome P450 94B3 [Amborella trichopoda]|uniref:cytochrome P450 94B3 n=1 Tax=Amborella trichopoda TaxID=13333 RepID=UPI0005D439EE|nr:cytochrome P450 94B3 [Amborella trichopoda]|eukprot:XP_011621790.1 cytochrome P450 94B3 [Amborella trichopoda]
MALLFVFYSLFFLSFLLVIRHFYHNALGPNPKVSYLGPKAYPIVGSLIEFMLNRHRFLEWTTELLSRSPTQTVTHWRLGRVPDVVTANPLNVEHMLKNNFENYPKGPRFISFLHDFLGDGIFNADGDTWKIQRKTASFQFSTKSLRTFMLSVVQSEINQRLIPLLEFVSSSQKLIDLQDVLERFAFDNVCKVAFGSDPACLGENAFLAAFEEATVLSAWRFLGIVPHFWKVLKFCHVASEKKISDCVRVVHVYANGIVRARYAGMESNDQDLMSPSAADQMLGSSDKQMNEMNGQDLISRFMADQRFGSSDELLRDVVISFILAGRDTTSSALSRFFWLLTCHPEVEKNILAEIQNIRETYGHGQNFGYEELKDMHYLHASLTESMRLYPPVPMDSKHCLKDDVLPDGTFVGKGWFITYSAYAMGRMEAIWGRDYAEFRPDRWLQKGVFSPVSSFKYPIFHAGPRLCLGKDMAYIQMKSIAACIIERYEIKIPERQKDHPYTLSLTLRMRGGLPISLRERQESIAYGDMIDGSDS